MTQRPRNDEAAAVCEWQAGATDHLPQQELRGPAEPIETEKREPGYKDDWQSGTQREPEAP
ncbi:MAG: hypothetical protein ACNA7J_12465 [Wenzhouxiangella sp.]